jgi:putative flippase GtrA
MAATRPDLHWAFAGWGPCDPAEWDLANVSVHRGRAGAEIAMLYRAADLLVLPSKSEGFPLVVQEALACGLHPVCCADAAEADSAAAPWVVGVSDEGSEADVVQRYLAAIDAMIATSDSGHERASRAAFARDRYSWHSAALRYGRILDSLCQKQLRQATVREASSNGHRAAIPRYLVVGGLCALVANAILIGFDRLGIHYVVSSVVSFVTTLMLAYGLHAQWTFNAPPSFGRFIRYGAAMALNLPLSMALLFILVDVAGLKMIVAAPLATALQTILNYVIARAIIRPRIGGTLPLSSA